MPDLDMGLSHPMQFVIILSIEKRPVVRWPELNKLKIEREKVKILTRTILIFLVLSTFQACSLRKVVIDEFVKMAEDGMGAFEGDDDLSLVEKAFPAQIKLMETLLESSPKNGPILSLLAKMYGSYAFLFFEPRFEAEKLDVEYPEPLVNLGKGMGVAYFKPFLDRYYLKGAEYAMRALEVTHGDCREKTENVTTADTFFKSLNRRDVPALFWYGFNLGEYVNLNMDSVKALSMAFLAEKAMLRVVELDPGYYHGSAHLFLMAYYGGRSPMMGGNPEAALVHYKKLKALAGEGFSLADLYYARYYLYQGQEKEKFIQILTKLAERKPQEGPLALLNRVAANRASVYLKALDYFF
jgi:hypothetical protein